jgi:hypothetical protein
MGNRVRFLMRGGVGNQMFVYAAGKWLAATTNKRVEFDARILSVTKQHDGFLMEFMLSEKVLTARNSKSLNFRAAVPGQWFRDKVLTKFSLANRRLISAGTHWGPVGFDPILGPALGHKKIVGRFQTYRYATEIIQKLRQEFRLKQESPWLKHQRGDMHGKKVLAIHVRRADYARHRQRFGLLSSEYYEMSLDLLKSKNFTWDEVWVFSDDLSAAERLLAPTLKKEKVSYVSPPTGTSPLESMMLFGEAHLGIIANSTFSWWASFLATRMEAIVAPGKWFKGIEDPEDLIPNHWHRVTSLWED